MPSFCLQQFLKLSSESYLREWIRVQEEFLSTKWMGSRGLLWRIFIQESFSHWYACFWAGKSERKWKHVQRCWFVVVKTKIKYANDKTNFTPRQQFANKKDFPVILSDFLFSSYGSKYKPNLKFEDKLMWNQQTPVIKASKFKIDYYAFEGPETHIPSRKAVTDIIEAANSPYTFRHCKVYAAWETDEIIGYELWRNIKLAMTCVFFVVTLLLLCNTQICIMVIPNCGLHNCWHHWIPPLLGNHHWHNFLCQYCLCYWALCGLFYPHWSCLLSDKEQDMSKFQW